MRHPSLDIIRDEHQALAAMLTSIGLVLTQARQRAKLPNFDVLRAMLFYIDEFPERLHHTKETELLFPLVRARAPELRATLDQLDREHHKGEAAIRELEHRLLAFEVMGEGRREDFEAAVKRYTEFYLAHMSVEEKEIIPAALRTLNEGDWQRLDEAFAANRDPLTGHEPSDDYRPLFQRIVNEAPAPIGLGPS